MGCGQRVMATGVEPHEPALVDSTQAYPTFVLLDTAARPENAPDVDGKAARHEAVLLRDPVALEHTVPGAAVDAMDTESVHLTVDGGGSSNRGSTKLGVLRLAALLFFSVSGGPVGTEGLIQAAGPFCSLIGLLVLPLFWCLPVGLMTAELATAFPKDGGYVLWVNAAFGGFGGFMMGWISWASGVVDTAIYPGMFVSFVRHGLHVKMSHQARSALLVGFNVVLSSSNLLGIGIAGDASLFFSAVVLLPVVILMLVSLPDMDPAAWLQSTPAPDWVHWINIAIWNTNGFDTISTFAGEVCTPMRTFPAAIVLGGLAVILPYVISIMAATAVNQDYGSYENGTYNLIAVKEGGWFVGMLFTVSTCAAAAGMYVSDITSYSYQLSGMAEEGMLPEILAAKMPGPGTPYVAIGYCVLPCLPFFNPA